MADELFVYGLQPVRETLRAGRGVERAYLSREGGPMGEIVALLKKAGVPVDRVDEARMNALLPREDGRTVNHQGVALRLSAVEYCAVDDILAAAQAKGEDPFLILLDGVTDPHNVGAILRSAEAMGAHGVVLPKRRSAGVNETAYRASSGAAAHILVARVTNLVSAMEELKGKGVWLVGTAAEANPCYQTNLTGPIALCIGSEGDGMSRLVRQTCDFMTGIPLSGRTGSLNASCAAAVLIYEVARQRGVRA